MKKFVVILLTTLLAPALIPAVDGSERGAKNALERPADRRPSAAASRIRQNDPAEIAKLIEQINAAVRTNKQRMLSIITINTDIAGSQLEREKTETGMTFGDIYVAHSLTLATKKKFKTIVALHQSGKSWGDIAKLHNVTLKGSSELIKEMQKQ